MKRLLKGSWILSSGEKNKTIKVLEMQWWSKSLSQRRDGRLLGWNIIHPVRYRLIVRCYCLTVFSVLQGRVQSMRYKDKCINKMYFKRARKDYDYMKENNLSAYADIKGQRPEGNIKRVRFIVASFRCNYSSDYVDYIPWRWRWCLIITLTHFLERRNQPH